MRRWRSRCATLTAIVCLTVCASPGGAQTARYDILITGGTLIDGSGAPRQRADLAIKDGQIVSIGALSRAGAAQVIEATGLVVAPGFIDVHTHADDIADTRARKTSSRMGVTSVVAGNCGGSALDVGDALTNIRQAGMAINFATLIGHNTVRRAVMGTANRDATVAELARMKSLVWRAHGGRCGRILHWPPVRARHVRNSAEILELARIAGNAGGLYASHMRNEGTELEEAVEETIRIGELAMCRVQISHLKVDSPSRWGASAKALALIDAARARGIDVQADQYAYTAASSTLGHPFSVVGTRRRAARHRQPAQRSCDLGRGSRKRCAGCSRSGG